MTSGGALRSTTHSTSWRAVVAIGAGVIGASFMRKDRLEHVKPVTAKGRRYEYFRTGVLDDNGREILRRLPPRSDPGFWSVYASLKAGRTRRENVAAELLLPAMIERYQASAEYRRLKPNTQKTYDVYLRLLADQLDALVARAVERRDIVKLRDTMADRPGAANGMVRAARALFAWGRQHELVEQDPCAGIELFESVDYEPWPDDLLALALASEDPLVSLGASLLYFTAQRIGDVVALRWNEVRDGFAYLRQRKTGTPMEIMLHRDLLDRLGREPRRGMTIIADEAGRALSAERLRLHLQRFAREQGHEVVPHGLRKNAVNALLEAGCTVAETAAVSGQSLQMVEHYSKRKSTRALSSAAILKLERSKA